MYYGPVFDMLSQHHPEYVALAWGSVKFVLMVGLLLLRYTHSSVWVLGLEASQTRPSTDTISVDEHDADGGGELLIMESWL
jgi:hypothetical protein